MPVYEYRCGTCDARFEARRPMVEANSPIACPDGHSDTKRLLSVFASVGAAESGPGAAAAVPAGGCGSACRCC